MLPKCIMKVCSFPVVLSFEEARKTGHKKRWLVSLSCHLFIQNMIMGLS